MLLQVVGDIHLADPAVGGTDDQQSSNRRKPERRCLKLMKCHYIYSQLFFPSFRKKLEPLAFGCSLPTQALTRPDSGRSEMPGSMSQILGESSFPQR